MAAEPAERLSEVLTNLQDLSAERDITQTRKSLVDQIDVLRSVQDQMQTQLRLHDAQIASLREVIALLSGNKE